MNPPCLSYVNTLVIISLISTTHFEFVEGHQKTRIVIGRKIKRREGMTKMTRSRRVINGTAMKMEKLARSERKINENLNDNENIFSYYERRFHHRILKVMSLI